MASVEEESPASGGQRTLLSFMGKEGKQATPSKSLDSEASANEPTSDVESPCSKAVDCTGKSARAKAASNNTPIVGVSHSVVLSDACHPVLTGDQNIF